MGHRDGAPTTRERRRSHRDGQQVPEVAELGNAQAQACALHLGSAIIPVASSGRVPPAGAGECETPFDLPRGSY